MSYNERIDPWLQVLWDQQGSDLLLVSGSAAAGQDRRRPPARSRAARAHGRRDRRARPRAC